MIRDWGDVIRYSRAVIPSLEGSTLQLLAGTLGRAPRAGEHSASSRWEMHPASSRREVHSASSTRSARVSDNDRWKNEIAALTTFARNDRGLNEIDLP